MGRAQAVRRGLSLVWMLKVLWGGPGEMAQLSRELAVLAGDLGSIPSTHDRRLKLSLLVSMGMWDTGTHSG